MRRNTVRTNLYIHPEVEGVQEIEVVVTDDDNESTSAFLTYEVLNVAPTAGEMRFAIDGIPTYLPKMVHGQLMKT